MQNGDTRASSRSSWLNRKAHTRAENTGSIGRNAQRNYPPAAAADVAVLSDHYALRLIALRETGAPVFFAEPLTRLGLSPTFSQQGWRLFCGSDCLVVQRCQHCRGRRFIALLIRPISGRALARMPKLLCQAKHQVYVLIGRVKSFSLPGLLQPLTCDSGDPQGSCPSSSSTRC